MLELKLRAETSPARRAPVIQFCVFLATLGHFCVASSVGRRADSVETTDLPTVSF
jgi:hypothetical protein